MNMLMGIHTLRKCLAKKNFMVKIYFSGWKGGMEQGKSKSF